MVRLVTIRELRELPVSSQAGYVRQLTQAQKTKLINRLARSSTTAGLMMHANSVSINLLSSKIDPGWDHYLPEEFRA